MDFFNVNDVTASETTIQLETRFLLCKQIGVSLTTNVTLTVFQ